MKILNLYCGIGGNRKHWDSTGQHEITAVEINPDIAKIYKDFFPNDNVIIADAHEYLLNHYKEYDFIWSSPPCPTHSRMNFLNETKGQRKELYPDMKLYEEIIFLQYWFKGLFCVENVIGYYEPLILPKKSNSHYFWTNFYFEEYPSKKRGIRSEEFVFIKNKLGFNLDKFEVDLKFKKQILNNCVEPEIGLYILEQAMNIDNSKQKYLFE